MESTLLCIYEVEMVSKWIFLYDISYFVQEAFFGRDLLDTTKEKDMGSSSDSDEEQASPLQVSEDKTIQLSQVCVPLVIMLLIDILSEDYEVKYLHIIYLHNKYQYPSQ